jgi:phage repressor protein C with HTH and peptisase S24 domain
MKEWYEKEYPSGYSDEYVDFPAMDENAYALRVNGGSMEPRMYEGEVLIIYPNLEAFPGDEVIVKMRDGEVMVKQLTYIRDGRLGLDSVSSIGRIEMRMDDLVFIHPVVAVVRTAAIKKRF